MAVSSALSRRAFGQLIGRGMAAASLPPLLAPGDASAAAPQVAGGVVRLSANENPYGPSPAALRAMREAFGLAWRYPDEATEALIADLARVHGMAKDRMRAFLDGVPTSTMVLVDEAYHHYADSPDYESVLPLVATHPNLAVARTFSKIHGMAGLRLGYAIAQPPLIKKLAEHAAWDSANIIALAAARASLADTAYVAEGRRRNTATKTQVIGELGRLGYQVVPSQTNFILIDTRKDVKPTIET